MTCKHEDADPTCASWPYKVDAARILVAKDEAMKGKTQKTPDAENYQVARAEQVGAHLVMKVNYPNCVKCKFEGNKVMVFLNITSIEALRWKRIDPHFRSNRNARLDTWAPSPAARFPASKEGWQDAINYAKRKVSGEIGAK